MSGLFGSLGSNPQQQQSTGLFGSSVSQQQPPSSLFGQPTQQQQQPSSIFGTSFQQPASSGMFGGSTAQPSNQQHAPVINLLGQSTAGSQPTFGGSILGQSVVQPLPRLGQLGVSDSQWRPPGLQPREKPVPEQIELLFKKWNPTDPDCAFQQYLYNQAAPDSAQFYHPGPGDDERKWEEALQAKPNADAIPFNVRGFWELGQRMQMQDKALEALRLRMHEVNAALAAIKEKHELDASVRAQRAREKHVQLARRVLRLAVTVQTLRNRGYALDGGEERLKKGLEAIAKDAFSPVLAGRQEEVWARLVVLRERANMLQEELKKIGAPSEGAPIIDEEKTEKIKKILKDYQAQLDHLTKELTSIKKDFETWETETAPGDP